MPKAKSVSIRSIGLEHYLNDTRHLHNDQGYDQFKFYLKYRVPHSAIGRMFNISSRDTITKWVTIYNEEQERDNATA